MWQQQTMLLWRIRTTLQKEGFTSATPSSCTFLSSIIELCNCTAQNCMHSEAKYMGLRQKWVVSNEPTLYSRLNAINHNKPTVHRQFWISLLYVYLASESYFCLVLVKGYKNAVSKTATSVKGCKVTRSDTWHWKSEYNSRLYWTIVVWFSLS